jgi:peroxiredoxin
MAALKSGEIAPDFSLPDMNGGKFSLSATLERGPVVAVFFKISCPTCQYALPFYERLYQAYGSGNVTVIGISQNSREDTDLFIQAFGIKFPVLLDDTNLYPASNAYGLTNVPTVFWIGQDREIEISSVGWDRGDFEAVQAKLAGAGQVIPVFQPGEDVAAFRAG